MFGLPFHLHKFPKDAQASNEWVKALQRKNFKPVKGSLGCSIHFVDGQPTSENPVPALHLGYANKVEKGLRPILRHAVLPMDAASDAEILPEVEAALTEKPDMQSEGIAENQMNEMRCSKCEVLKIDASTVGRY